MTDPDDELRVTRVEGRPIGRALPILTFLVGILLGAAIVKPWDLIFSPDPSADARPSAASGADASIAPVASPIASPSPIADDCAFAGGWRVFAVGRRDPFGGDGSTTASAPPPDTSASRGIGEPLRRWLEIVPTADAADPEDPAIPFVTIVSDRIAGLSYCPPPGGVDGPPGEGRFTAWRTSTDGSAPDGTGATALTLRPATLDATSAIRVPVYVADDATTPDGASWATGRYVFRVGSSDDPGYDRWFGVELRAPSGPPPG